MYGKSNMETYIIICKIDSQQEFAQETQTGAMDQPRGGAWGREMGGRCKREETYVYLWLIRVEV